MKKALIACAALALLVPVSSFAAQEGKGQEKEKGPKVEIVRPGEGGENRKKAVFAGMDDDGDGAVSTQELIRGSKKRFETRDLDGNGWLSLEEFQAENHEDSAEAPDRDAEEQKNLEDVRARRFERLDSDGNGVLSVDEVIADGRERHTWMDVDGDGRVTQSEVDARRTEARRKAQDMLQTSKGLPKRRGEK